MISFTLVILFITVACLAAVAITLLVQDEREWRKIDRHITELEKHVRGLEDGR